MGFPLVSEDTTQQGKPVSRGLLLAGQAIANHARVNHRGANRCYFRKKAEAEAATPSAETTSPRCQ
jgi:hypothetical protein